MIKAPEQDKINYYCKQIEMLRVQMIEAAMDLGLNHPNVLQYSQQIDEKHNKILMIKKSKT
jgi:hypothetical protein